MCYVNEPRRVHVTQSVVEWLGHDYDVEPGHGANRSEYLYKHNITTYLVKDNQLRMKVIHKHLLCRSEVIGHRS